MKYRKKPVVIEAYRISSLDILPGWLAKAIESGTVFESIVPQGFGIKTLEGTMYADPDDFIIKGVQGELYPCKPDIFEQTYEKVEENSEFEIKEAKIAKAIAATGLSEQQIRQMISNGKMPMGPWIAMMEESQR